MISRWLVLILACAFVNHTMPADRFIDGTIDCVILLHGLTRTSRSMRQIEQALATQGFHVVNVDYPSRKYTVETLASLAIEEGINKCPSDSKINFVTHSLGGILVRYYFAVNTNARLGRVVMLAPPNQGSEVVDRLKDFPGFDLLNGPAGSQLGTGVGSVPMNLGAVDFELGVIAGTATINPILSQFLPNPDDGKVSVARTKVAGMKDFVTVTHAHPFLMDAPEVIELVIGFIKRGSFASRSD